MSGALRVAPSEAIAELAFILGYAGGGELPVFVDGRPNPVHRLPCDRLVRSGERLARIASRLDMERSAEVSVGLPSTGGYVYGSTVLWAHVSGGEQVRRAAGFAPAPSVVLRTGGSSERLLLWALRNPVSADRAELLNSRISYALGGSRVRVKPDVLRVPLPGTFARAGRERPAPVLVTRLHVVRGVDGESVAGGLRDPPPRDAWRERQKA